MATVSCLRKYRSGRNSEDRLVLHSYYSSECLNAPHISVRNGACDYCCGVSMQHVRIIGTVGTVGTVGTAGTAVGTGIFQGCMLRVLKQVRSRSRTHVPCVRKILAVRETWSQVGNTFYLAPETPTSPPGRG